MKFKTIKKGAEYVLLTLISCVFALPLLFLIFQAFSGISGSLTGDNFLLVLLKSRNNQAFSMGMKISLAVSLLTIALSLTGALLLSRRKGKNEDSILSVILLLSGLPFCTLVIPLYFVLFALKLLDSVPITILFLAAANIPSTIWILRQFMNTIPGEIEETSRIDGTTYWVFFSRILLPQLLPVITGTLVTTFINCWGNFIVPFILLSSSDKLPTALAFFQVFSTGDPSLYGYLSAYAILYYIPVIALFLILRLGMPRLFVMQRLKT